MPIRMTGLVSGLDTESIIKELMSAQQTKLTKIENKQTKLEWQQEKWKELNTKLYSLYTDKLSKLRLQSTYLQKKATTSNESKVKATGNSNAVNGSHTLQIKQLASAQQITSGTLKTDVEGEDVTTSTTLTNLGYMEGDEITITNGTEEDGNPATSTFTIESDSTMNDFLSFVKDAGLNASFDTNQKRLYISSKESGEKNSFSIEMTNQGGATGLEGLGLGSAATTIKAQDAIFQYNGVEYTESDNSVEVNGLTMQLFGTTSGYGTDAAETISITVDTDVDAVYNSIKDFITSYNEVLKEMNDLYYADSARGYEPLTDEQKEAMSDDEVEKWETKIKDALLRGDSTLGSLISGMKNTLSGSVSVGDTSYTLSSFGILSSSDYTEKGLLHIYGDSTDSTYADKDDKLKSALSNDLTGTMKALSSLFGNLYSKMTEQMSTTTLSSALTFYNDKELNKLASQYKKEYSDMEDRLETIEDRYYDQFSAMETALEKLNSQQSYLSNLLGTSS